MRIILENTQDVFDRIAPGWYNRRHRSIFRYELEALAGRWRNGRLLNIGCAHGPDFIPFKDTFELCGIDSSPEMLKLAVKYSEKYSFQANLVVADAAHLPYANEVFDYAIAVATFHHMRGREAREAAVKEMRRVLKPGGEGFITVWNRFQPRFWLSHKETLVPWRTKEETFYRYYYLYSYPEIERLVKQAGFEILQSFPEHAYRLPIKLFSRNICLLVKKQS